MGYGLRIRKVVHDTFIDSSGILARDFCEQMKNNVEKHHLEVIKDLEQENKKLIQIIKDMKELPIVQESIELKQENKLLREALDWASSPHVVNALSKMHREEWEKLKEIRKQFKLDGEG